MTDIDARKIFGRNLTDIMYQKRITQRNLGKYMGVSSATTSDWCSGKKMPRIDRLTSLANYLGVSMTDLVEDHIQQEDVEESQQQKYYLDDETAKIAQEIFDDSYLHALFRAARGSKHEDVQMVTEMLNRFKGTNPDG